MWFLVLHCPSWKIRVAWPVAHSSRKNSAIHSYQCVQCFLGYFTVRFFFFFFLGDHLSEILKRCMTIFSVELYTSVPISFHDRTRISRLHRLSKYGTKTAFSQQILSRWSSNFLYLYSFITKIHTWNIRGHICMHWCIQRFISDPNMKRKNILGNDR